MDKTSKPDLLQRLASVRSFMVLLVLYAIVDYLLLHSLGTEPGVKGPPLDLMLHYSPAQAHAYLDQLGAAGRAANIRAHATLDVAYPLVYSSLFAVMITLLTRALALSGPVWRALALLPFMIMGFDLAENLSLIILAMRFPAPMPALAHAASLFTIFKWVFAALVIGAAVLLGVAALIRVIRLRLRR